MDTDPGCYEMTKKTTARPATITTPSTVNATNMNKYDFYSILLQLIFFLILSFNLSIFFVSYKYIFCIDLSTLYKIKLRLLAAIFRGKIHIFLTVAFVVQRFVAFSFDHVDINNFLPLCMLIASGCMGQPTKLI